ncbi:MAG TPA: ATP-binding protein, partial [Polyangiales bacterium]
RHLSQCRAALVQAADDTTQRADAIHAAFRAMHTLKGNAGMMGLAEIEALARAVEWALEGLREGDLALTGNLTVALLNLLEKGQLAVQRPRAFQWQREAEALDVACTEARYLARRTRIGALLVEHSFVSRDQVELVLAIKREPLGQALILLNALDEQQLGRALELQQKLRAGEEPGGLEPVAPAPRGTLVERQKLEQLVRRAAALRALLPDAPEPVLRALDQLERGLAACDAVPVREAFRRAAALSRELAKKQRKQLAVSLHGEELELPRSALGAVSDALVHLVRNAVDHGVEPEFERVAAAKDALARLSLTARADGDTLSIEVIDDGRGLSRERLLQRAIECGLVELHDAHRLADPEVYALIFLPGLSTTERPNDVSGKGVGMDAVKHAIEAVGGQVSVQTTPGQGTRVRLSVPLRPSLIPTAG